MFQSLWWQSCLECHRTSLRSGAATSSGVAFLNLIRPPVSIVSKLSTAGDCVGIRSFSLN